MPRIRELWASFITILIFIFMLSSMHAWRPCEVIKEATRFLMTIDPCQRVFHECHRLWHVPPIMLEIGRVVLGASQVRGAAAEGWLVAATDITIRTQWFSQCEKNTITHWTARDVVLTHMKNAEIYGNTCLDLCKFYIVMSVRKWSIFSRIYAVNVFCQLKIESGISFTKQHHKPWLTYHE